MRVRPHGVACRHEAESSPADWADARAGLADSDVSRGPRDVSTTHGPSGPVALDSTVTREGGWEEKDTERDARPVLFDGRQDVFRAERVFTRPGRQLDDSFLGFVSARGHLGRECVLGRRLNVIYMGRNGRLTWSDGKARASQRILYLSFVGL